MAIDFLIQRFKENKDNPAIIWQNRIYSYSDLLNKIDLAKVFLAQNDIRSGNIVALNGDFTPNTITLLLALIDNNSIIVPFTSLLKESEKIKTEIAGVQKTITVNMDTDSYSFNLIDNEHKIHPYYQNLHSDKSPGLVLFTSGTSGNPKGAVHNFNRLLEKFKTTRKGLRTVNFLLFDHWGGLNTLFHTLSNCGVVLALRNRKPDAVCKFIQEYKIELLPVSPSFLNLLILSDVYKDYDLSSLKLITYGTEPMPETTLKRAKDIFSEVKFQQTYGLIELGVLRSKSKSDDSLWVKMGGDGFQLRVVDNILQIKAESAMLGYLNAPSPFTDDGFFITGDMVEQDGEYYKILGRKSELINVGGEKVYPQEVENVILGFSNILDVTVHGEKHPLTGNIVCAKINLENVVPDQKIFIKELKSYCRKQMQSFKVPVKIVIVEEELHSTRFKKQRTE